MDKSKAKVLFWVDGYVASAEDKAAARKLDATVHFRNAYHVPLEGALEKCDGVAGNVPERYKAAYPTAEEAIAKFAEDVLEVEQIVGDIKAPEAPVLPIETKIETPAATEILNPVETAKAPEAKVAGTVQAWGTQTTGKGN